MWRVLLVGMGITFILYYAYKKGGENTVVNKYTLSGKLNLNWVAIEIAKQEGKKIEVNIGQIKEILKITTKIFAKEYTDEEILRLLKKYK